MNYLKKAQMLIAACLLVGAVGAQQNFEVASPNGKLKGKLVVGKTLEYQVLHGETIVLDKSPISMTLEDGEILGQNAKLASTSKASKSTVLNAVIYKKAQVENNYNELTLNFKGDYSVVFRAYNDGVVYRFQTNKKKSFVVKSEQAEFNFPANHNAYIPYVIQNTQTLESQLSNSFENRYEYVKLSDWNKARYAFTPILVEGSDKLKVAILEADLFNYPGMFLYNENASNTLKGVFAPYPDKIEQGGHNMLQGLVKSRKDFIAQCDGKTAFPWRAIVVAENDYELANSDMVYKLATPSQGDYSWVKPGKVAWDWWNTWNLHGVDFEAGINNETYKYYIDFASEYGIEYVILDEGWAVNKQADMMQVVPEIDLNELVAYGKSKNVDLILWAGYHAINRDMEGICKHYSDMGIKGFKVDFMDRDDQPMVKFHTDLAVVGAKHKLLIDYHGTYKPTGLHVTYPNVINFEGVFGLEQMKWAKDEDMVTYDVTMPFIRMMAGPVDYTQGAMRNATKSNFRSVNSEAMSQGTRCRQLAEYIIFESPLNMLCDNPSNYMNEKECTSFIAKIPTTWDETVALNGEVAKYISIARKKGNEWYLGSLTNWDARDLELDLSFLGAGSYQAEVFRDGINADKAARDYKREVIDIPSNKKLNIHMAPGGGYIMRIYEKRNAN